MRAPRLTYANAMATVALFFSLGGVSYAAVHLKKNSVGTAQLKNNSVSGAKIQDGAVTGAKVDLASLGTVPNAAHATRADSAARVTRVDSAKTATTASSARTATRADSAKTTPRADVAAAIPAPEAEHFVSDPGGPGFAPGWTDFSPTTRVAFYKDQEGFVHLSGEAKRISGRGPTIFTLPAADTPEAVLTMLGSSNFNVLNKEVEVAAIAIEPDGAVMKTSGEELAVLNKLVWRAAE